MPRPDQEKTLQHRLGNALARLRERRALTPAQLARAMGESSRFAAQISTWENGQASPPGDQLWRYLDALDLSFSDLDLELDSKARNPRLRELAGELDAMAERRA